MTIQQKALKNSSKAWVGKPSHLVACTLSLLTLLALTPHAFAKDTSEQTLVYEVYAGGIHAVQATLQIDIKPKNRYSIDLSAKTRGFLSKLVPWSGTFESHGWRFQNGDIRPEQHKSVGVWRGKAEIKDYAYAKNGTFKQLIIDDHDKEPEIQDVDKIVTDGTTDALTATLLMLKNYNETGKCEGMSRVFDGKRSFDQKFAHQENVDLVSSKYNIYEGPAAKCTVEVIPKDGKWHTKPRGWLSIQEQGREKGTIPTIWVASMKEGAPAIPVKIFIKTDYGAMFMHLAEYQNDETKLVAEKRVVDEDE